MSYIDEVLQQLGSISSDDILQRIGGDFYGSGVDWNQLLDYPQFVQDIVFLVDMDSALMMDGDVLINNFDRVPNMILALKNIRADTDSLLLQEIYDEYVLSLDYDEVKANEIWSVTISDLYKKMYYMTGFDIWSLLIDYVDREKNHLING